MSACKYPNLMAEHKDGWWCIDALAHGAGVSSEIMKEVLLGNDGLTSFELMKLGNYIFSNYDYVRIVTYAKYRKVKSDMESVIFDCEPVITRTHKLCEEVLS